VRKTGRTTRLILNIVNMIAYSNEQEKILIVAPSIRIANQISNKLLDVCATLGLPTPKITRASSNERVRSYCTSGYKAFFDHTWHEFGAGAREV